MKDAPKGAFFIMNTIHKKIALIFSILLLSACVVAPKKPDLELLYSNSYQNKIATPVIIIPGLMGSSLVNEQGVEVWPGSMSDLVFSSYAQLTDYKNDNLKPGRLIDTLVSVDFYSTLLKTLEKSGGYQKADLGKHVLSKTNRRYYIFIYDWRKSNFDTVTKLHELIEQIRLDYQDPNLKVDIIAHSNGGLIARYYLQYGPQTKLTRMQPEVWRDGANRIRRIAMLGTPNLGSVLSVKRLYQGFELGFRTIPPHLMAYYATPFEALPSPGSSSFIDMNGTSVPINIFDVNVWQQNKWSVFSDEIEAAIRSESAQPDKDVIKARSIFSEHLMQAYDFQNALTKPLGVSNTEIALFGGDCDLTNARALVNKLPDRQELVFEEGDIKQKQKNLNYRNLLFAPGDGLVTRDSILARASNVEINQAQQQDLFAIAQTIFFCEKHSYLTSNPYFQNNLLYFILH